MRRQRNMAQMKEENKTPQNELNKKEITGLSEAEFKTLVIRMLKELTEYGKKIREEMKVNKVKERKIYREPTVEGMKPRVKPMIWNTRKIKKFN